MSILNIEIYKTPYKEFKSFDKFNYFAEVDFNTSKIQLLVNSTMPYTINDNLESNNIPSAPIPLNLGFNIITIKSDETIYFVVKMLPDEKLLYKEEYRPQFHYSTQISLLNDPNGLIYNKDTDEYHLYYQYQANTIVNKEMKSWGHAISKDLINWKENSLVLEPDKFGEAYSGSAVIDYNNTSGLFSDNIKPNSRMVILYTSFNGIEQQNLAYSFNNGKSFIKYEGNPIICNDKTMYSLGFRDPKVIWYNNNKLPNGGIWLMVVAGEQARIFTSNNLINWSHNFDMIYSDGSKIISECPDLFPMFVNGNTDNEKWVFIGNDYNNGNSKIFYVVGNLTIDEKNKINFTSETNRIESLNDNPEVYASQTFYNDKYNRKIMISWIRDWVLFGGNCWQFKNPDLSSKYWLGTHTLPQELKLIFNNNEYKIYAKLIDEEKTLRTEKIFSINNVTVKKNTSNILKKITEELYEIECIFDISNNPIFSFNLRTNGTEKTILTYNSKDRLLTLDKSKSSIIVLNPNIYNSNISANKIIKLNILVDTSIIDIYVNDGEASISTQIYPNKNCNKMVITDSKLKIFELNIFRLNSIWNK